MEAEKVARKKKATRKKGSAPGRVTVGTEGIIRHSRVVPGGPTEEDVATLRKIVSDHGGGKDVSLNSLTDEEIQQTEPWARQMYAELEAAKPGNGTKSPYFRRWFGDWRAYDTKTRSGAV